ncbi:hypothetical protein [Hymenobacter persicinus]|uniref:Uncharacterized protein n=1 Tax=Hymenobacter persicinus TaxID=2025506 RepID=A0A4V1ZAS6_9BACT|nr:hypothetical protein [Hymenobacter persicinus]RYU79729.1 hypothetical protein EWM57_09975 [Hymenobacter persicinus]
MEINRSTAPEAEITALGRWLAGAQQLKDTITILGMNFLLLFGLLVFGLPIPGLVLYFLRWRLVRGKGSRAYATRLWACSLVHEVLCAALFASTELRAELHELADYLCLGYALGALLSAGGLLTTLTADSTSYPASDEPDPA